MTQGNLYIIFKWKKNSKKCCIVWLISSIWSQVLSHILNKQLLHWCFTIELGVYKLYALYRKVINLPFSSCLFLFSLGTKVPSAFAMISDLVFANCILCVKYTMSININLNQNRGYNEFIIFINMKGKTSHSLIHGLITHQSYRLGRYDKASTVRGQDKELNRPLIVIVCQLSSTNNLSLEFYFVAIFVPRCMNISKCP